MKWLEKQESLWKTYESAVTDFTAVLFRKVKGPIKCDLYLQLTAVLFFMSLIFHGRITLL